MIPSEITNKSNQWERNQEIPITVVIPVKNEEGNLPHCLRRLADFCEVVVVDSQSTDATVEIAEAHGAKTLTFVWNGHFPKKRNWILQNYRFKTDWVLFLDADEFVDKKFCAAVREAVASSHCSGYWLNYTNYFLGSRLRFGLRQRKLALFKVGSGLYERVEDDRWTTLDMEVHEHPILHGSIGKISCRIEHNDFRGLERFLERHVEYANWEARRFALLKKIPAGGTPALTQRQRFKYSNLERWWYPWFYFSYTYLIRLGFLDGAAGFHYAFFKLWYFQTVRLLIRAQSRSL
jgi:glycosyltransferase involved in cell wall biosynthesis